MRGNAAGVVLLGVLGYDLYGLRVLGLTGVDIGSLGYLRYGIKKLRPIIVAGN